ncbi:predicted protein [Chaetomium globosum CBS 148.51]|uniref:Uncharacterized protein n=1 Tax=Chaetomium globosum (strain ATCC 6205 / CBS 148.51 / DSM 1962 / NBRC 6347 / NRRL 1970) TaxID=306901 RepID=Q2H0Y7_CHAGB|nr:uncharacterized protein CHGG_04559 [Chaetomium globosum CBS 148.51]EAQ87940.1 predicted protein [Chaetomium globosum CBS 148.51]
MAVKEPACFPQQHKARSAGLGVLHATPPDAAQAQQHHARRAAMQRIFSPVEQALLWRWHIYSTP